MAQGWCHESVDIATAQGAVQQLRATVPHRSSVAAAASVAVAASPVHKAPKEFTVRGGARPEK